MKKILLFGAALFMAGTISTNAWSFGGLGILGHKSSHKGGVNAIGVHIDANGGNETPNITLANCDAYAGTGLVDNETYNGGYAGLASDNQTQCRCPAGTKWNDGACITSEGASCTSWTTNECGTGYYCQFNPESCEDAPTGGVCKDIGSCGTKGTYGNFWMSDRGAEECRTDWWTAQSICVSQEMRMVRLVDVGCEEYKDDVCPSQQLSEIRNANLSYEFWTTDLYEEGNPNSCDAYSVHVAGQDEWDNGGCRVADASGTRDDGAGAAVLCIK